MTILTRSFTLQCVVLFYEENLSSGFLEILHTTCRDPSTWSAENKISYTHFFNKKNPVKFS